MPDATTLLNFRHLLETHDLCKGLLSAINADLAARGLLLREGTLVDATLIAAPSSTKNAQRERDPEMHQTRKGNQWYFGMKAHLLDEAESGATGSKLKEAERLRELIANVGKPGTPGEHIRCVVSVQMLTEGWDANNVTQILGLRAFGSQLLCEQVVGRGLRRINYDPCVDPATGEERLRPEYVDVYGIPFSVIPFKGRKEGTPEPDDKPTTLVQALPERLAMEMKFPNVDGYVMELRQHCIRCDVRTVEPLRIQPTEHPTQVYVQPQVGVREGQKGTASFALEEHDRESFTSSTTFKPFCSRSPARSFCA